MATAGSAAERERRFLRRSAGCLLVLYLLWNALWWWRGELAPSILLAVTGIPAPTTGMTRALRLLLAGNVMESLAWNALAVPLLLLFMFSAAWLLGQVLARRRMMLPEWAVRAWIGLLLAAWALKFTGGPAYW